MANIILENTQIDVLEIKQKASKIIESDDFKKWFGGSKATDNAGNPKIYYHRSSSPNITQFRTKNDPDYERAHSVTTNGIYFFPVPSIEKYGPYLYGCFLNIKKPLVIENSFFSDIKNPYTNKKINVESINDLDFQFLTENGYDGVIALYPTFQTVVFNPNQIYIINK